MLYAGEGNLTALYWCGEGIFHGTSFCWFSKHDFDFIQTTFL